MDSFSFAAAILASLSYFLQLESDQLRQAEERQFFNEEGQNPLTYDFIVVGGGTAGCIVASRLSRAFSVLLIEAGGEPPSSAEVPGFYEYVSASPDLNYFYTSIPQQNAMNRKITKTTGKMLGGTGSHNALVYNRGSPRDYDNWADITRDSNWSYHALLKYFRKAETYKGIWPKGRQHGTKGPIPIETSTRPIYGTWKEAAAELGYKVTDPNGPQTEGFTPSDVMRQDGRRASTYVNYLQPILFRKTLKVVKYAQAEKILFRNKVATGVRYIRHGVEFTAHASKEVILSAGVFATPLLLFKSGIGPAEMLAKARIEARLDLPVGRNLQEHAGVLLGPFTVTDPSKLSNVENNLTQATFKKYLDHKRETVLSETGLGPQAFFVSPIAKEKDESDWPDVQFFHVGTNFGGSGTSSTSPPNQFSVAILIGRPEFFEESLGTVKLNTSAFLEGERNNDALALIDYKYLESEQDYKVLRYGIQLAMKVFTTKAFEEIGTQLIPDSDCIKRYKFDGEDYWKCFIETKGTVWYHAAGTCRMSCGDEDQNSVVDPKLRVHGVTGLRVVDASIMPRVTNANTNAAVVVIAEKASADISRDHKIKANYD